MENKMKSTLNSLAGILEIILATFIAIGVIIGLIDVVKQLILFFNTDFNLSYNIFKDFLSYVLLMVIGVEFILMLLTHSKERITELVVFVIARKLLIYGSTMLDMVLGSLAIGIIFGTLKYLTPSSKDN